MAGSGRYGFGIVGVGMIAEFHGRAIEKVKGGRLVCAFELDPKREKHARAFARQFGCELYMGDYDAFLRHPGLDIVTIATPSGAHLEPTVAAANAGKHIICEKPLEITLERCDRMLEACRRNRVKLAGLFPCRATKCFSLIKDAVQKKRFGRLTVCNAFIPWLRTQAYYDSGGWRGTWKLDGGGALMNQSIHTIDLLQWLAGLPKEVHAYAGNLAHKRIEVEDTAVASLKFKSGALGVLVGSTAMWPGYELGIQISGDKGSAWVTGELLTKWQFEKETARDKRIRREALGAAASSSKGGASDPRDISFYGHQVQCQNMVNCLNKKEKLLVDGKEARKAVEFILAVYDSALSRKPVKLPLKRTPKLRAFPKG